ncbi:GGDEF domain-containing protein [Deinococcus indicus]|nr:GGDEF domain-containing protein [Deinococcus indicus]
MRTLHFFRSAPEVLPEPASWHAGQRRMFTLLVWLACAACGAALLAQYPNLDPLDRWALPLLSLNLIALQLLLSAQRITLQAAVTGAFVGTAVYVLLALNHQFGVMPRTNWTLMENTYWFAVLYAAAFLVFPPRQATWLAAALLALSSAICAYHLTFTVSPLTRTHLTGASVQFLLTGTVMTVMQATLGVHRMQLLASHAAAHTDTLTGIGNRRAAEERLADLTRAAQTYTLVLFDLDHFKRVNDMHGHAAGDLVLKGVAQATLAHLPPGGLATRWGGEEFLLILPEQTDRQVRGMLDALRLELRHQRHGKVSGVTACFGVATAAPGEDPERVLGRADSAMYTVKEKGRNDVHLADLRRTQIG